MGVGFHIPYPEATAEVEGFCLISKFFFNKSNENGV